MKISFFIAAFFLDICLGDPYSWPHPVKVIGHLISFFEKRLNRPFFSKRKRFLYGFLICFVTVALSGLIVAAILIVSYQLNRILYGFIYIYLTYSLLALKSLSVEGLKVFTKLKDGTLEEARYQVSMIIGRDTSELSREEITKATIETMAENLSDGVIAPLFYILIGGPVLGMMYKAINTLDSMIGYQTPKYQDIGYASAKLDDWVNYIPARITWFILLVASYLLNLNVKNAWEVGKRDRRNHQSPNSGYPESVVAGALEIQLGGTHRYHGVEIFKPHIGDPLKQVSIEDILTMNQLLYLAGFLSLVLMTACYYIV